MDTKTPPEEVKEIKAPEAVQSLFAPEALVELEIAISKLEYAYQVADALAVKVDGINAMLEKTHELADSVRGKIDPAMPQAPIKDKFKLPLYHRHVVTLKKDAKEPYAEASFEKGRQITDKPLAKNDRDIESLNAQSHLSGHRWYKAETKA